MSNARNSVRRLAEDDDVDSPDLASWGERLSVEDRLTKIYGTPVPYFRNDPAKATHWAKTFCFGNFEVYSTFIVWYKIKYAPGGNLAFTVQVKDWKHHDSETIYGYYNVLKLVELLEAGIAQLTANPPTKITEVTSVFHDILHYAYTSEPPPD